MVPKRYDKFGIVKRLITLFRNQLYKNIENPSKFIVIVQPPGLVILVKYLIHDVNPSHNSSVVHLTDLVKRISIIGCAARHSNASRALQVKYLFIVYSNIRPSTNLTWRASWQVVNQNLQLAESINSSTSKYRFTSRSHARACGLTKIVFSSLLVKK